YHYCRYAEYALGLAADLRDTGPGGRPLTQWLPELKKQNAQLARTHGFEKGRAQAERRALADPLEGDFPAAEAAPDAAPASGERTPPRGSPLPARGAPTYWLAGSDAPVPRLRLVALAEGRGRETASASLLLLALVLGVWALTYTPRVAGWVRAFWPEQAALLGCLAWALVGPNGVAVFLVLCGTCGRLLVLGRWAPGLLNRPAPVAAGDGTTSGT